MPLLTELCDSLPLPARPGGVDTQLGLRDGAIADATLPQRVALAQAVYTPEVLHPVEVGADQEMHLVK